MWTTISIANAALTSNGWTRSSAERWQKTVDGKTATIRSEWDTAAGIRLMRLSLTLDGRPLCDIAAPIEFVDGVFIPTPVSDAEVLADINAAIRGDEVAALWDRTATTLYSMAELSKSWVAEDEDVLDMVEPEPGVVRRVPRPADAGPDEPVLIIVRQPDGTEETLRLNPDGVFRLLAS